MSACENCRWFKKGQTTGLITRCLIAGGPRYRLSTADILYASQVDKDGACTLNPDPVQKRKSDVCGQWTKIEAAA